MLVPTHSLLDEYLKGPEAELRIRRGKFESGVLLGMESINLVVEFVELRWWDITVSKVSLKV